MGTIKSYRFRLEPSGEQRLLFARYAGCCRFVFNQGLAQRIAVYEADGQTLSYFDQVRSLTEWKRNEETAWLAQVNAQVLQQSLKDLDKAYKSFFRRVKSGEKAGFPRFKKKGKKDSFRFPQRVRVSEGRVFFSKIGWIRYRASRSIEGKILQAVVKREGPHWFVVLTCRIDESLPVPAPKCSDRAIGIDVGLKAFAYLSNGQNVENPRFLERALRRLRVAQRNLRRKERFSSNWRQQVRKISLLHIKVKNCRRDFIHKLSTDIVKNHDVIAVENLNISGMVKNATLARAISDAGWGAFRDMLKYKSEWAGKHLVAVDRFLPTSQTCSNCGGRTPMPLSMRTYVCNGCGLHIDRDWNASLNIRSAGLAVLGITPNACGGTA